MRLQQMRLQTMKKTLRLLKMAIISTEEKYIIKGNFITGIKWTIFAGFDGETEHPICICNRNISGNFTKWIVTTGYFHRNFYNWFILIELIDMSVKNSFLVNSQIDTKSQNSPVAALKYCCFKNLAELHEQDQTNIALEYFLMVLILGIIWSATAVSILLVRSIHIRSNSWINQLELGWICGRPNFILFFLFKTALVVTWLRNKLKILLQLYMESILFRKHQKSFEFMNWMNC